MRRPLRVIGETSDRDAPEPIRLDLSGRIVSVTDTHDGLAAERFARLLRDGGATEPRKDTDVDLRIVIRATPQSPEARLRAEALEAHADIVLGSARAAFARRLAQV